MFKNDLMIFDPSVLTYLLWESAFELSYTLIRIAVKSFYHTIRVLNEVFANPPLTAKMKLYLKNSRGLKRKMTMKKPKLSIVSINHYIRLVYRSALFL